MTTQQHTRKLDVAPSGGQPTTRIRPGSAADRAYQRRDRRQQRINRLTDTGRASRSALAQVPFVLLVMVLLAGGIGGVLWLNTLTDSAGIEQGRSERAQRELRLQIEAEQGEVAALDATPRIAEAAKVLGLVPAGDAAHIIIDAAGNVTVLGEPIPVPTPAAEVPPVAPPVEAPVEVVAPVDDAAVEAGAVQGDGQ